MRIPSALLLLCLVKKLTVNGIIGNMHGINSATNPKRKPCKNIDQFPSSFAGAAIIVLVAVLSETLELIVIELLSIVVALLELSESTSLAFVFFSTDSKPFT